MSITINQALELGIKAHKDGHIHEADKYYTAIIKAQPSHPHANHNMGVLAVDIGKTEESLPFFKKALEANDSVEQFWISYVDALIKLNRYKEGQEVCRLAELKDHKGEALNNLALKLKELNGEKENSHPKDPSEETVSNLMSFINQKKYSEVLKYLNTLIEKFPESSILYNIIGAVHFHIESFDKSIEYYKKALSLNPQFVDINNNIGLIYKTIGDIDEGIYYYN